MTRSLTLAHYEALAGASLPAAAASRLHEAWGEPADDPDVRDGAFRFRAQTLRQRHRRAAARSRPRGGAPRRLSRSGLAAAARARRLRAVAAARRQGRRARAHGRARHAGMAAGQGGRAHRGLLSGNRHRAVAGDLSVHRQQSGRSRAGQAPHCRHHDRPPAAAAGRRPALSGDARELERLVDEYAQADGLDRRRRERLAD